MELVVKVSREQLLNVHRKGYLPYGDQKEEQQVHSMIIHNAQISRFKRYICYEIPRKGEPPTQLSSDGVGYERGIEPITSIESIEWLSY
jgi:hypothetical protein